MSRLGSVRGRVCRGASRGKALGYPTANMEVTAGDLPEEGIYAARVELAGRSVPAAASVGQAPSFEDASAPLEVHLLDFDGDLYGRELTVTFVERLRAQTVFTSMEDLKVQIARDVASVREVLRGGSGQ